MDQLLIAVSRSLVTSSILSSAVDYVTSVLWVHDRQLWNTVIVINVIPGDSFSALTLLVWSNFWPDAVPDVTDAGKCTCMENLEILDFDSEISGILLKVREMLGKCQGKILLRKSSLKLFIVSCIFAFVPVFSQSVFYKVCLFWFWIMHCCMTPTTDNNTGTVWYE